MTGAITGRPRGSAAVTRSGVVDVSVLPSYAYGHRSLMWWGTMGVMAIEGMVFALAVGTYLYLRTRVDTWPPALPPPDLRWGVVNTLVLLASAIPNHWTKRAAEREDLRSVRIGIVVCLAFAVVFLIVRILEFSTLNCRWDSNAYGSAVWMLMGLHTTHLITDAADSVILAVLMFTGPLEGKRFVDVSENAIYWYFVVFAWLPIAAIVYLAPRLL